MSSFNFINISAFWWLLSIPVIIIFYFLKLKREQKIFPSTLLWRKTIEDLRVNSPFQRLKNNLLLFLQCLLVLLLIFALSRPFLSQDKRLNKILVILIDNSASMQVKDEPNGQTRLEKAQKMANDLIEDLHEDDQAMIISLANPLTVSAPFSHSKNSLHAAVLQIVPTHSTIQIEEGLIIANNLTKGRPAKIVVLTDGAIERLETILQNYYTSNTKVDQVKPEFIMIGNQDSNVAILAFELNRLAQGFARFHNLGSQNVNGLVQLYLNGELFSQANRLITLKPGDIQSIMWNNLPIEQGKAELVFSVTQGNDYLELDNHAYFYLAKEEKPKIALISSNIYLQKMAQALSLNYETLNLEEFIKLSPQRHYDAVIIEGISPATALPPGNYLIINALPSAIANLEKQQDISAKQGEILKIIDQNDAHPVMRFVDMRRISLVKAMGVKWPSNHLVLLEIEHQAIITTFNDESHRYLVVAFDLWQSNWPLQMSFPIFIQNAMNWFQEQNFSTLNQIVSKPLFVKFRPPYPTVNITLPNGKSQTIPLSGYGTGSLANTQQTGFYYMEAKINEQVSTTYFAVNLFSPEESNIARVTNIQSSKIEPWQTKPQMSNREIWEYFIIAAVLFLMFEWQWYHRQSFSWAFLWQSKISLNLGWKK